MHFHRLAALALGAWIAGSLFVMGVTRQRILAVETLVTDSDVNASRIVNRLGPMEARALLRYQAYDANLTLRRNWELVELALGAVVMVGLFFGANGKRYTLVLCLLMLMTVVFLHWFLAPEVARLTAGAAFIADSQASVPRDRLNSLQTGYSVAEIIKLGFGFLLAFSLIRRRRRRRVGREHEVAS